MIPGGAFLAGPPGAMLTPEALDEDARLMGRAAAEFLRGEALPAAGRIEAREPGLMESLLRRAAGLGLLGIDAPEQYGGLGLSKSTSALITESLAAEPSFSVSHSVHTSVATLPIVLFGTPEQKSKYLPPLCSGARIGAYALSEAHAGSDAMAARTRALRTATGYALTGEKMWITNAAFAGLFIVFAQTDDGLTAFVVERETAGLAIGREEHKLGLKGSSTCRLILDGAEAPEDNLLGRPGEGGRIALYTLNLGRFKIAAASVGQSKNLLGIAAGYAKQRVAFGRPIAEFGLIQEKLAGMAARTYAAESMLYRVAGLLDGAFAGIDAKAADAAKRYRAAAEEYAIECAIVKVYCTEALGFVADECLQIHGGYGFTEEFPAARAWRDARVTRIYEGTNEINRLNIAGIALRRIRQGRIQVEDPVWAAAAGRFADLGSEQEVAGALADWSGDRFMRQSLQRRNGIETGSAETRAAAELIASALAEQRSAWANRVLREALGAASAQGGGFDSCAGGLVQGVRLLAGAVCDAGGYPWR